MRTVVALFLGLAGVSSHAGDDAPAEVFDYRLTEAGLAPLAQRVTARADGACDVVFRDGTSQVKLTADDLGTFEKLLAEADLPVEKLEPRLHALVGTLRVSRDGSPVEFRIVNNGRTEALSRWILRIMYEADYLRRLREGKDIYLACSVLDPRCQPGPDSVLHPAAFREPLERLLESEDETNRLRAIVAALSCVTTPEEWSQVLDRRLNAEDDARVDALVSVIANHPFPGNEQPSHYDTLMKLLFDTLKREYPDMLELPKSRRTAGALITRTLGHERYKPAIPVFVGMIERYATIENAGGWPELASMGADALDPLARLLASPKAGVRIAAVRTVQMVLERNPRYGRNKLSEEEQETILRRLRGEFAPRIREMVEKDPEPWVRKWAVKAVQRIESGWKPR